MLKNSQNLRTFLINFYDRKKMSQFSSFWMPETGYFPNKITKIRSLCFERKAQINFRSSYFPPHIQGENKNYKIAIATK